MTAPTTRNRLSVVASFRLGGWLPSQDLGTFKSLEDLAQMAAAVAEEPVTATNMKTLLQQLGLETAFVSEREKKALEAAKLERERNAGPRLRKALDGMVSMYVRLVDSGDAGNWDAETVDEVIEARAAIKEAEGS